MLFNYLLKYNDTKTTIIKIFISVIWFTLLLKTSSYLSVYFYIFLIYIIFIFCNKEILLTNREQKISILFSCIFSLFITISNYDIYNDCYYRITKILGLSLIFISGCILFFYILVSIYNLIKSRDRDIVLRNDINNDKVFFKTFVILLFIYLIFFFLIGFPGYITEDGISQISQIETGIYNNHHPIWHTFLIKIFYDIGLYFTGSRILAVSTFTIFQIIIYALIVSFSNSTLSNLKVNIIINIVFCAYFALMPFNIIYSFTLTKDVIFSLAYLLFATCYVRINQQLGNKYINSFLFIISIIGIGLFRTNGKFVLILLLIFSVILFRKEKTFIVSLTAGLTIVLFLNIYSSNYLKIQNPDAVESLSMPIQQVSRVICEKNDLNDKEYALLNHIVDVNLICKTYNPTLSDPMKDLIRIKGNQHYLMEHISDYISLYFQLGLRHPIEYIDAWVDQTKAYFNGGYYDSIYYMTIANNDLGIYSPFFSNSIFRLFMCYNALFSKNTLQIFVSSGFQTWLIVLFLYIGIMFNNKKVIVLSLPSIFLILTLLIATPSCIEFRYSYPLYMTNLFICFCSIFYIKENK